MGAYGVKARAVATSRGGRRALNDVYLMREPTLTTMLGSAPGWVSRIPAKLSLLIQE
jgi:hypothetical protein